MRRTRAAVGVLLLLAAACTARISAERANNSSPSASTDSPSGGIAKLQHLIFIVQENRSFDQYFGTFPGADGFPMHHGKPAVCVPDPVLHQCDHPYHSTSMVSEGGPHGSANSSIDVDGGKMDGFIRSAVLSPDGYCAMSRLASGCLAKTGPQHQPDVMSYHDAREIPNYWDYAHNFVLQDHMFAPSDAWTLPSHLFLVSAWSATCSDPRNPMSCSSSLGGSLHWPNDGVSPYAWTDLTYLLNKDHVSWGYYIAPDSCWDSNCVEQESATPITYNPLVGFGDVRQDRQIGNIQTHDSFFKAAAAGTLPAVSWVVPSRTQSEHPDGGSIADGQAFVTSVVNAVGRSPDWSSSAIFITWDDWGGFYDHVKPPTIDGSGYGIRVPGLMISPYAKSGLIDHQTLSFDAYLKLIEDRFLGGQRLDPKTDGRPDSRPLVREDVPELGNLQSEFDFGQSPRPPLLLPQYP